MELRPETDTDKDSADKDLVDPQGFHLPRRLLQARQKKVQRGLKRASLFQNEESKDTFESVLTVLHFADNQKINDKFYTK